MCINDTTTLITLYFFRLSGGEVAFHYELQCDIQKPLPQCQGVMEISEFSLITIALLFHRIFSLSPVSGHFNVKN